MASAPTLTAIAPGGTKTFVPLLCPTWLGQNIASIRGLLDIMDQLAADHPGAHMLATLDDVDQAFYTSGHTIDANELDPIPDDGDDEDALPNLATRRDRLLKAAEAVDLDQLQNRLWWSGEGRAPFFALQDDPDQVLDRHVYIQAVPVANGWESLAAFPNGYFHGDFNPMENLVLARHLEETFGYALFGIGASYVGFRRKAALSQSDLAGLADFIVSLHATSNDPDIAINVRRTLEASDLLVLCYVDR